MMDSMLPRASLVLLAVFCCACKPTEESHMKAIVGAVLIDGLGGPPLSNSVVVVAGGRIREAGRFSTVQIPAEADKVDGSGKFLVPGLIDVYPKPASGDDAFTPGHPATPDAARAQVAQLAARAVPHAALIHIWNVEPDIAGAALQAARGAGIQAAGHVSTQADARRLLDLGANGFIGIVTDTDDLAPGFVALLSTLQIFVAPQLVSIGPGPQLDVAKHNTRRLFSAGIPIAIASAGGDGGIQRETELLVDAGIPPLDVIVAATRHGAAALRRLGEAGTIQAGKRADLLLLSANPGEDIRNLNRVALRMSAGEWVR
jgi:imidazolonepropionase-like amidohydrolase